MISLLRKSMIHSKKFVRYYKCRECPEATNMFTTTFKVNLFTFMVVGSIGGTITRSHIILKNDLEELKLSKKSKNIK
jgi:hypothetical protein